MCGKKQLGMNQRVWKNLMVILICAQIKHTVKQRDAAAAVQPLFIFMFKYSGCRSSQETGKY